MGLAVQGAVHGSAGLTIEQAVTLDTDFDIEDTGSSVGYGDFNDFNGLMNDEGTSFVVAIETHVGHIGEFSLPVIAHGDAPANATLQLMASPGIDLELDSDGDVDETQISKNTWLLRVDPSGGTLYVTVRPKADLRPGFYAISGRIVQVN